MCEARATAVKVPLDPLLCRAHEWDEAVTPALPGDSDETLRQM